MQARCLRYLKQAALLAGACAGRSDAVQTEPSRPVMKPKTRIVLWFVSAGLLLGICGGIWWLDASGKAAVAAAKERYRAAGLPMTIEEILPPTMPDAENAAPLLAKIETLFDAFPEIGSPGLSYHYWLEEFREKHSSYPLNATALRELGDALEIPQVREVLALLDEAATKGGLDARSKPDEIWRLLPDEESLNNCVLLLYFQVQLECSRNQAEAASAHLWTLTRLAELVAKHPLERSQWFRHRVWEEATDILQKMAATGNLPQRWNNKFAAQLDSLELAKDFARALDECRIRLGVYSFERLLNNPTWLAGEFDTGFRYSTNANSTPPVWMTVLKYRMPGVLRSEYARFIDYCRMRSVAVAQPETDYRVLKNIFDEMESDFKGGQHIRTSLIGANSDMLNSFVTQLWTTRAKIACARVGLALERYRAAMGDYPGALAALAPEFLPAVPADIFNGQPLHYRRVPGGVVVYSVGPNLRDDGGVEDRESNSGKDDPAWHAGKAAVLPPAAETKPAE